MGVDGCLESVFKRFGVLLVVGGVFFCGVILLLLIGCIRFLGVGALMVVGGAFF